MINYLFFIRVLTDPAGVSICYRLFFSFNVRDLLRSITFYWLTSNYYSLDQYMTFILTIYGISYSFPCELTLGVRHVDGSTLLFYVTYFMVYYSCMK